LREKARKLIESKTSNASILKFKESSLTSRTPWQALHGLVEPLGGFLRDPAVRYGIKLALAGMLAFYIALLLRLDKPLWSVITVFMLMNARYFGAMTEKSVFRIMGTIAGGITGFLLTGSLQQEPVVFLTLVAAVVAFSTTMFGQTHAPYAFLLFGLTTSVVAANGIADPSNSWQVALARTEEVVLGVLVTLFVSALVWPVFARVEFKRAASRELLQLGREFGERAAIFLSGAAKPQRATASTGRLAAIRNILHAGSRESAFFRSRLPTYTGIIRNLSRIATAVEALEEPRILAEEARSLRPALDELRGAVENAFPAVAVPDPAAACAALDAVEAARTRLNATIPMRNPNEMSTRQALDLGAWIIAVEEIASCLADLHRLNQTLPENPAERRREELPQSNPPLDPFWITNGIRSGIAVAIALVIQNWLNPPGGALVTLATWIFCALSRLYPGGEGDRGAFKYAALTALWGLLYIPAMLILSPVMSDYLALNILLAASLFLYGLHYFGIPGMSFGMQLGMLAIAMTLSLNSQEPVTFQQIADVYFGIVIGVFISAVVQRLLWPVLPQRQLRDRFLEWLDHIEHLASDAPLERWRLLRVGLLPAETSAWASATERGHKERLEKLLRVVDLFSRVGNLLALRREKTASPLPPALRDEIAEREQSLISSIGAATAGPRNLLQGLTPNDDSKELLQRELAGWGEESDRLRQRMIAGNVPHDRRLRAYAGLELTGGAVEEMLHLLEAFPGVEPGNYAVDSVL